MRESGPDCSMVYVGPPITAGGASAPPLNPYVRTYLVLNPSLRTPLDVLHKLEREMHRAFHHRNYVHKADHFYNFCITAHSLRMPFLRIYASRPTRRSKPSTRNGITTTFLRRQARSRTRPSTLSCGNRLQRRR